VVTAFKKAEGVSDASVNFDKKTATVTYDPAKTDPDKLVAALKDTRYTAAKAEDKKDDKKEDKKDEKKDEKKKEETK
jgi:copper chaperone CopZ